MQEDTLRKVMRFTKVRDVWLELHRLFDGTNEDKTYNLCMSFFSFKRDQADNIATHMSKLKNIWTELNQELKKDNNQELPELLLVCKILDTLDDLYFSFRSSWLLLPKSNRTVESLTSHLCAFERALQGNNVPSHHSEALVSNTEKKKDKKLKCNYCLGFGHRVRNCQKWIRDGKPPKCQNPTQTATPSTSKTANLLLMSLEDNEIFTVSRDNESCYIDNGATSHVTNRADIFQTYEHFNENYTVTTAAGNEVRAKGKGTV
uniref:Retrovirus-related Pol polyprotein from transposon TNT 1-94-like beta-barrel domain-containing protein n=1 Tax=Bombyx mori TaxID=7091 RepID=A0A8R2C6K0_BOMMO|nr:uncharacterized protein LOC105841853 [Bombyx mori]